MASANQLENAAKRRESYDLKYKFEAVQCDELTKIDDFDML